MIIGVRLYFTKTRMVKRVAKIPRPVKAAGTSVQGEFHRINSMGKRTHRCLSNEGTKRFKHSTQWVSLWMISLSRHGVQCQQQVCPSWYWRYWPGLHDVEHTEMGSRERGIPPLFREAPPFKALLFSPVTSFSCLLLFCCVVFWFSSFLLCEFLLSSAAASFSSSSACSCSPGDVKDCKKVLLALLFVLLSRWLSGVGFW